MMSLPTPIQILARADDVTILLEWNHLQRQIHVDGRSYPIPYPMAAGVSTGHWQGGTLVVTTRGHRIGNGIRAPIDVNLALQMVPFEKDGDVIRARQNLNGRGQAHHPRHSGI